MKRVIPLLFLTMILGACLQVNNSSTLDPTRYGSIVVGDGSPGGQRFAAAYGVFQSRCFGCHPHGFEPFTTESEFTESGYVVPGDLAGSVLFQRIRGSGVPGKQDMPKNGTLSTAELSTIRTWIEQIGL
jgi:hypothetical protein